MRDERPFGPDDLQELDERLLARADAVVALREVYAGNRGFRVIQMRHDVDNAKGAFDTALRMAEWEAERGYRSTYYLLHTASYWMRPHFDEEVRTLALMGHEVGIHVDAILKAEELGVAPANLLMDALTELRDCGVAVRSAAGHGNRSLEGLANDQVFDECRGGSKYSKPLADYGLDFEAVQLGRGWQLSDSSGKWPIMPFDVGARRFPDPSGQLHLLIHPDWWGQALAG